MNSNAPDHGTDRILIIGYGNVLRQDDGVGVLAAECVEDMDLPEVDVVACAQLSPEHAALVAEASVVVFVDAVLGGDEYVRLQPVSVAESSQVTTHALEPGTLLALARQVYGRAPRAWMIPVPARLMGFGELLSPEASAGLAEAVRLLDGFIQLRLAWRASREYELAAHTEV